MSSDLFAAWERVWAPRAQPFFLSDDLARRLPAEPLFSRKDFRQIDLPLSLHDTFATYDVSQAAPWVVLLTHERFRHLERVLQLELLKAQPTFGRAAVVHLSESAGQFELDKLVGDAVEGHFVWWPELWARLSESEKRRLLQTFVETDRLPCVRTELSSEDWEKIAAVLPGARPVAGSFLPESGGNCLATVIAAFGNLDIAEWWIHPEPFERWLARHFACCPDVSPLCDLGTILVWREDARVQHAAVCFGTGFVLHKEVQGWFAPRQVMQLEDVLGRWQDSGCLDVYVLRSHVLAAT